MSGEIETTIGGETSKALVDAGAALSVLNPTLIHCPLPRSKQSVQIVEVSNLFTQVLRAEPVSFQLGTITGKRVSSSKMCHDSFDRMRPFRSLQSCYIAFSQKGEMLLDF